MGADRWEQLAPWNPDPSVALLQLQARFLTDNVDFASEVRESLANVKESVRFTREEGDPYNLLPIYQSDLEYLEEISSRPLPTDPQERIAVLRRIYASGAQGLGNILDIESVEGFGVESDDDGWPLISRPLTEKEIQAGLGSATPTIEEAKKGGYKLSRSLSLDRGESICFPVYDESRQPVGWWFIGYTVD
jgi:hypothetical protein